MPASPSARPKLWLSWSSGKDSAWALHALRRQGGYEIAGLLTTINETAARVAMHAVRETLLERQAEAAGLPLIKVRIPQPCPNEAYEAAMAAAMDDAKRTGVTAMAFGDLFLEDVRAYREELLASSTIEPVFPLWRADTSALANEMIDAGVTFPDQGWGFALWCAAASVAFLAVRARLRPELAERA